MQSPDATHAVLIIESSKHNIVTVGTYCRQEALELGVMMTSDPFWHNAKNMLANGGVFGKSFDKQYEAETGMTWCAMLEFGNVYVVPLDRVDAFKAGWTKIWE